MEPPPYSQEHSEHTEYSKLEEKQNIQIKPPTQTDDYLQSALDTYFPPSLAEILNEPTLVLGRQIEHLNIYIGYDQPKKYHIYNGQGKLLGHMIEKSSFTKAVIRQAIGSTRSFIVLITNIHGELLLEIKRSFTIVNSTVMIKLPYRNLQNQQISQTIGYSNQIFHPLKRKYKLATKNEQGDLFHQFGEINCKPFGTSFAILNDCHQIIGVIDRNWTGIVRKLFTESSTYVIRFDMKAPTNNAPYYTACGKPMGLSQRAVLLGCAVSIDLDYFSPQHHHNGA